MRESRSSGLENLTAHIQRQHENKKALVKNMAEQATKLATEEDQGLAPTDAEKKRTHRLNNDSLQTDIQLKRNYGYGLIILMTVQLVIMNAIFLGVGLEKFTYSDYVLHLYISGTLLELFGLVFVITKYLFRK